MRERNTILIKQNRERFDMQCKLKERIGNLSQKRKYQHAFTRTQDLRDFISFKARRKSEVVKELRTEES